VANTVGWYPTRARVVSALIGKYMRMQRHVNNRRRKH